MLCFDIIHMKKKLPELVYYVSSSDDTALVALDVVIDGSSVSWFDTIKERRIAAESVSENLADGTFTVRRAESEGGGEYVFIPLTLEIYASKVKRQLLAPRDFKSRLEMLDAFQETKKHAW